MTALKAGNLQEAKELFGPTRTHYEAIEPVAESFGDLDPEIDARVNDVANVSGLDRASTASRRSCGCRARLGGTGIYAAKLLADVTTLYHACRRSRTSRPSSRTAPSSC